MSLKSDMKRITLNPAAQFKHVQDFIVDISIKSLHKSFEDISNIDYQK